MLIVAESTSLLMQIEEKEEVILPIKGILLAVLAEIQLKLNQPEKALKMAEDGLDLGKFGEDYWVIGENLLIMAKIYYFLGDKKKLEFILEELENSIKGRLFFDLEIKYGIFIAKNKIEKGEFEIARQWLGNQKYMYNKTLSIIYPEIILLKNELETKEQYFLENKRTICLSNEQDYILSYREIEILKLIRQGYSNAEIAKQLFISINTVKTHISNMFEKLGVNNRLKIVYMAEKLKLI